MSKKRKLILTPVWAMRGNARWAWWCWEPINHYQRTGSSLAQSGSEWLSAWYERIHNEKTVKMMADMGINVAVTHFFKGMGRKFEQPEMDRTRELVKKCHKYAVRVIGYTQLGSIYNEIFPNERKEAVDWIQRDPDGKPCFWNNTYFRWKPCINNEGWIDYVKEMIQYGIESINLDGFHFDNSSGSPCYCDACKRLFRKYLSEKSDDKITERLGIGSLDYVDIPRLFDPRDGKSTEIHDPLYQEWIRFRCRQFTAVYAELNSYIKSLNPEAVMLGNYGHWCGVSDLCTEWSDQNGEWLPDLFATHDYTFAENENVQGVDENGIVTHQIKAFKVARAGNIPALSTTGVRNKCNWNARVFARDIAEAAAFGSIPGTTWALRPWHEKGNVRFAIDKPEYRVVLKKYMSCLKKHSDFYCGAEEAAEIAILHCETSFAFDPFSAWCSRFGVEEILIAGHIPYRVIFDKDFDAASKIKVLIIADSKCLPDALCRKVVAFVRQGGKLLLTGESGWHTENFGERLRNGLEEILRHKSVIYLPDAPEKAALKSGYQRKAPLPLGTATIVKSLERLYSPYYKITAPKTIAVEWTRLPDGRHALHLINYANEDGGITKVNIKCREKIRRAVAYSPDFKEQQEYEGVDEIPVNLNIYTTVVLSKVL